MGYCEEKWQEGRKTNGIWFAFQKAQCEEHNNTCEQYYVMVDQLVGPGKSKVSVSIPVPSPESPNEAVAWPSLFIIQVFVSISSPQKASRDQSVSYCSLCFHTGLHDPWF